MIGLTSLDRARPEEEDAVVGLEDFDFVEGRGGSRDIFLWVMKVYQGTQGCVVVCEGGCAWLQHFDQPED